MNSATAKKGVGLLLTATKSGLSSLTEGISKTRKAYAAKHETDVLADLNKKGLSPSDLIFKVFQRVYFLYTAGYKHELVAAAQMAGKRLVDSTRTSVPLDVVIILGNTVVNECSKYGDFEKGTFYEGMQDMLAKAKMSKDHADRETLVHDAYYAVLMTVEKHKNEEHIIEQIFKDAVSRIVGGATYMTDGKENPRIKAAKSLYLFAAEISACARDAELKRQRAVEEAAELLRKEKERQQRLGFSS